MFGFRSFINIFYLIHLINTAKKSENDLKIGKFKRKIFNSTTIRKNRYMITHKQFQSDIDLGNVQESVSAIHTDMPLDLSSTKKVKIEDTNIQISTTPQIKNYCNFDNINERSKKLQEPSLSEHIDQTRYNSTIKSPCLSPKIDHLTPQKYTTSVNINERNQISQREHIFNLNHMYPYSYLMKNHFNSQIVDCCSTNNSHPAISQKNSTLSGYEVNNDPSNVPSLIEQHKVKSIPNYGGKEFVTRQFHIKNYFSTQLDNEFSIMDSNSEFFVKFQSLINIQQTELFEANIPIICHSLKDVLASEIDKINCILMKMDFSRGRSRYLKTIDFTAKSDYFCPLCSTYPIFEDDYHEIEEKFINEFIVKTNGASKLCYYIKKFFIEVSNSFKEYFTIEKLFKLQFFRSPRTIFENLLNLMKSEKFVLGQHKKIKYLHAQYHKLFLTDVDMKLHFLPELQSIIYVFLKTSKQVDFLTYNHNFMILFYSFYSLNMFFSWIHQFYYQNKTILNQSNSSYMKFVCEYISFTLRICFIGPMYSQLSTQKNAQIKYHSMVLNILYTEICKFLSDNDIQDTVATNSRTLLPVIIFMEKNSKEKHFSYFLHHYMHEFIHLNYMNIHPFLTFLNAMHKANIIPFRNRMLDHEKFELHKPLIICPELSNKKNNNI